MPREKTDWDTPTELPRAMATDAEALTEARTLARAEPAPPKEPACPTCGGELERYRGSAARKHGTAFCHACGLRHRL
jgi:predicted RNA-binding Zn-ribbon protein involved in translation (DUF1610 family)